MLVDSHAHLQFSQFEGDRQAVVQRAIDVGVSCIVVIGTDLTSSREALGLAEQNGLYATVGFHPHGASAFDERNLRELEELAAADRVVAIGEIGLDYFRNLSPRDCQIKAFKRQLQLAVERDLPVVIHVRNAHEDAANILDEHADQLRAAVLHCYSGGIELARSYLDREFYFSVSGQVTYRRSEALRETVKSIPIEKILLETDAPYLPPEPVRGKRNEPSFLVHTARHLAELKGMGYDEVCRITSSNSACAFSIDLQAVEDRFQRDRRQGRAHREAQAK